MSGESFNIFDLKKLINRAINTKNIAKLKIVLIIVNIHGVNDIKYNNDAIEPNKPDRNIKHFIKNWFMRSSGFSELRMAGGMERVMLFNKEHIIRIAKPNQKNNVLSAYIILSLGRTETFPLPAFLSSNGQQSLLEGHISISDLFE